jgi:hypothetical protein
MERRKSMGGEKDKEERSKKRRKIEGEVEEDREE